MLPWAIVTSGSAPLVEGWLTALKLPRLGTSHHGRIRREWQAGPDVLLARRGRSWVSDPRAKVLVLEDSPAGIKSGKAAGCFVLGLVTQPTAEQVVEAGPDWVVRDLTSVKLRYRARMGRELPWSSGMG